MKSTKKGWSIATCTWGDAHVQADDITIKKARKLGPVVRTTVGFLVTENEHGVVLCTDIFKNDHEHVSTPMFIPAGMIIELIEYD